MELSRSSVPVLGEDLESKDVEVKMMQWINIFEKDKWIMKIVLVCVLFVPLPHILNLGTRFLLVGVSCYSPRIWLKIVAQASMHHV